MSTEPFTPASAGPRALLPAGLVLPLFAGALFTGALLIFWIEPMFTKMVLPLLGGSPSVWNTAVMFFQAALLAGYSYAHFLTKLNSRRLQAGLHLVVLAAAAVFLPVAVAPGWMPPSGATPVPWLIGLLAISLGLPFFAVAATAPLLQRWFAASNHGSASDPYFLYGASNLGSMIALLGYPALIEPRLRLGEQSQVWSIGYVVLMALIGLCALALWHAPATAGNSAAVAEPASPAPAIAWRRRLHWLLLACAPSSLLLGVTTYISTDIAAIPLIWIVPLALYLLTFVIAFARRPIIRHGWMVAAQPFVILPLVAGFWFNLPSFVGFPLHLLAFFVTTMVCHGELNRLRPAARHLTEFYFWMSFGGLLGGAFNVLAAPLLFNSVLEYPLALVLAVMLRPRAGSGRHSRWDAMLPVVVLLFIPLKFAAAALGIDTGQAVFVVSCLVLICAMTLLARRRPLILGAGIAACLASSWFLLENDNLLTRERSFFGIHTVKRDASGQYNLLIHGTTVHGAELLDEARRREPQTYYLRGSPISQVMVALAPLGRPANVAVIGLGLGSTACYKAPGQHWTFFEIDPAVERLARDTRYFHFMADCAGDTQVVIGDGRLSLARAPAGAFDLLVLDAFSSDAIPMHLMTRQALRLYFDKLAEGGVIALHISNRSLDLEPVVANLAFDAGAAALIQRFRPDEKLRAGNLAKATDWVLLARRPQDLAFIAGDARWTALPPRPEYRVWTDDYSNILEIFRWN